MTINMWEKTGGLKTTQDGEIELSANSNATLTINEIDTSDYTITSSCKSGYGFQSTIGASSNEIGVKLLNSTTLYFTAGQAPLTATSTGSATCFFQLHAREL